MSLIGHTLILLKHLGIDVRMNDLSLKQNDVRLIKNTGEIIFKVPTEGFF
jgi:hypothetical protein